MPPVWAHAVLVLRGLARGGEVGERWERSGREGGREVGERRGVGTDGNGRCRALETGGRYAERPRDVDWTPTEGVRL